MTTEPAPCDIGAAIPRERVLVLDREVRLRHPCIGADMPVPTPALATMADDDAAPLPGEPEPHAAAETPSRKIAHAPFSVICA